MKLTMYNLERELLIREKQMIAKRTAAGLRHASYRGRIILGRVPFGYQCIDGQITVHPEEAEKVLEIFNLIAEGYSCKEVSNLLNNEVHGHLNRNGLPWTPDKIRRIAKSETYLGDLFYNKTSTQYLENGLSRTVKNPSSEWKRIRIDPIVTPELFQTVHLVLRIPRYIPK